MRSAVIAYDGWRAGGHRFDYHVTESVRGTREQEKVGICIKACECFAALFASEVYTVVSFEEFLDFFEVPAITHVHEFYVVVLGCKFFPDSIQEFKVLFL